MPEYKVKIAGSGAEKTMHSLEQLKHYLKAGFITPDDFIFDPELGNWKKIGKIEELENEVNEVSLISPITGVQGVNIFPVKTRRIMWKIRAIALIISGFLVIFSITFFILTATYTTGSNFPFIIIILFGVFCIITGVYILRKFVRISKK